MLRTVVMRPVFYPGWIGLCIYFLFPLQTLDPDDEEAQTPILMHEEGILYNDVQEP